MNHSELKKGDIISVKHNGQIACFHIHQVSKSCFWRRNRTYQVSAPFWTDSLIVFRNSRFKMWVTASEIQETLDIATARVWRNGDYLPEKETA